MREAVAAKTAAQGAVYRLSEVVRDALAAAWPGTERRVGYCSGAGKFLKTSY